MRREEMSSLRLCIVGLIALATFSVYAAFPTVESLFRNSSNADMNVPALNLQLKITPAMTPEKPLYAQISFLRSATGGIDVWQALFEQSGMLQGQAVDCQYLGDLRQKLIQKKQLQDADKEFFYSLLFSLVWNDSAPISSVLSITNSDYRNNSQLINVEQQRALAEYENFLIKNSKKRNVNPAKDAAVKVGLSYYQDLQQVKLARMNNTNYLVAKLENTQSSFQHENRYFRDFFYQKDDIYFRIAASDSNYVLFDGIHFLPKTMRIQTTNKLEFTVEVMALRPRSDLSSIQKEMAMLENAVTTRGLKERPQKDALFLL